MTDQALAIAFSTGLSLIGLWVLFFFLYRDYRIDLYRQRLFAIRDKLFDLGRTGVVPFDHAAYGITRSVINGHIRYAHRIKLFTTVYLALSKATFVRGQDFHKKWVMSIDALDPEPRRQLTDLITRVHFVLIDQMLLSSATMWVIVLPVALILLLQRASRTALTALRKLGLWGELRGRLIDPLDLRAAQ